MICPVWENEAVKNMKEQHGEDVVRAMYNSINKEIGTIVIKNKDGKLAESQLFKSIKNTMKDASLVDVFNRYQDTYTPQFKTWFSQSKMIDKNGEPLLVYHGSPNDFSTFDKGMKRYHVHSGGIFFAPTTKLAKMYGENIYPVYLKANSVDEMDSSLVGSFPKAKSEEDNLIKTTDAEGVIFRNTNDKGGKQDQYVVFEPNQVKSLFNNGSFLKSDNDGVKVSEGLSRGNNFVNHKVYQDGEVIGEVSISVSDNYADIWNTNVKGRFNAGTYTYLLLGKQYAEKGKILRSDTKRRRNPASERLWQRLQTYGNAIKENDQYLFKNDTPYETTDNTLFSLKERTGIDINKESDVIGLGTYLELAEKLGLSFILEDEVSGRTDFKAATKFKEGLIVLNRQMANNPENISELLNELPEELAHFFFRFLKEDSDLKKALWDAIDKKHPLVKELQEKGYLYKNRDGSINMNLLQEEAIGKLIKEALFNEKSKLTQSFWSNIKTMITDFLKRIGVLRTTPFEEAAIRILNSDLRDVMTVKEYNTLRDKVETDIGDVRDDIDKQLFRFNKDNNTFTISKSRYPEAMSELKRLREKYPSYNFIKSVSTNTKNTLRIESKIDDKVIKEDVEQKEIEIMSGNQFIFNGDVYPTMSEALDARYRYYNTNSLFSLFDENGNIEEEAVVGDDEATMDDIADEGTLASSVKRIMDLLKNRIGVFNIKNQSNLAAKDKALSSSLLESISNHKSLEGLLYFLENSLDEIATIELEIADVTIDEIKDMSMDDLSLIAREISKGRIYSKTLKNVISNLVKDYKRSNIKGSDKIYDKILELRSSLEDFDSIIDDISLPVVEKFLEPFATNPNISLHALLKSLHKDLTWGQRFLDAMHESPDEVLQIIDTIVKEYGEKSRMETYNFMQDILSLKLDLEKKGINDTEWMYEKDNGEVTGLFVSQYNETKFFKAKNDFFQSVGKKPTNKAELKKWNKKVGTWFSKNTTPLANWRDIVKSNKKTMSEEEYQEFLDENVIVGEYKTYPKGSLVRPADMYQNEQYIWIMTHPVEDVRNYYEFVISNKQKVEESLPPGVVSPFLAPQIRKDYLERLTSQNSFTATSQYFLDNLRQTEDENEFGSIVEVLDPITNEPFKFLPLYYIKKLGHWVDKDGKKTNSRADTNEFVSTANQDLSLDSTTAMIAYMDMANRFKNLSGIIDILELSKDMVFNRDVIARKSGKDEVNKDGTPRFKRKGEDYAFNRLQDYFNMQLYGQMRKNEGKLTIPFTKIEIDLAKAGDMLGSLTSLTSLGLNLYAGISNVTLGNILIISEAKAAQFYSIPAIRKAHKTYVGNLKGILGDIGSRLPDNKISIWVRQMDVLQDFRRKTKDIQADRKKWYAKLMTTKTLFFMTQGGEHQMQTTSSLGLAYDTKVLVDGEESNLYDAYEVVDNRLVLKPKTTTLDGKKITPSYLAKFKRKQDRINQQLHGIYNDEDKAAYQQYTLGRLAGMFRKFVKPGINRRYQLKRWDNNLEAHVEGYYQTARRLFSENEVKEVIGWYLNAASAKTLTKDDIYNIRRMQGELVTILTTMLLTSLAGAIDDDDEEHTWFYYMALYQLYRLKSEMMFYWNPEEFFRILESPAAAVNQLESIVDFFQMIAPWNIPHSFGYSYQRGYFKGMTPFQKFMIQNVPVTSTGNRIFRPEDMLRFFTAD